MTPGRETIVIEVNGERYRCHPSLTLAQALAAGGYSLEAPCGGRGTCGRCRVRIHHPHLEPSELEIQFLDPDHLEMGWRLACRRRPVSGMRLSLRAESFPVTAGPDSSKGEASLEGWEARPDGWLISAPGPYPLGVALDVGTTSLAGYLLNLESGTAESAAVMPNPQLPYGPDVVSRVAAASNPEAARALRAALLRGIDHLLDQLVGPSRRGHLQALTVVGNAAMHHFILGLPTKEMGTAPYRPYDAESRLLPAADLGLRRWASARAFFPPLIWGFVGSDVTAGMAASGLGSLPGVNLYVDLGTNSEIVLSAGGRLKAAAAAAGPAFEGGNLSSGMRATPGAISRVSLGDRIEMEVVGGTRPRGITGSGTVDFLADALRQGLVDPGGRIDAGRAPHLGIGVQTDGEGAVRLELCTGVFISQGDVRQIQLAKAAVAAGISALLAQEGLSVEDVDRLFLAGAFGNHIGPESAMRIGLFPPLDLRRIIPLGNSAGRGAQMILLSSRARDRAEEARRRTEYLELASDPTFKSCYLNLLSFPPP